MSIKSLLYLCLPAAVYPLLDRISASDTGLRLARGVFWSTAGALVSRGLMLCATVLVARVLGKTGYGELGMINSTIGMFGVVAGFGLGVAATKYVAEFRQSNPERAGRIIALSRVCALVAGGLMALGLLVFAPWFAAHTINAPHLVVALRVGALMLLINSLNGVQTGALAGLEAFRTIARINLIVGLISFPLVVCGAYLGGLVGVVMAMVVNLTINWLLNHLALRREANRYSIPYGFRDWNRERAILWTFSIPSVVSSTMVGPVLWVGRTMLANQPGGYAGLGALAVADSWRIMLLFACGMITQAAFPILSQQYGDGDRRLFKKTLAVQFVLNCAIVCIGSLIVIILSGPIMSVYGPEFEDSSLILVLVMVSCIPMQLTVVAGMVNKCVGNIWWGALLNGLWAVVYLVCVELLIGYGAVGLAWAGVAAYSFHLITTAIYVRWIFRNSPKLMEGSTY